MVKGAPPMDARDSRADWRRTRGGRGRAIAIASLAIGVPVSICGDRGASAGALGHVRASAAELDALHTPDLLLTVHAEDPARDDARNAIDGKLETAWTGRAGQTQWRWTSLFAHPVHLGLIRAHFGTSAESGVPTVFRWEALKGGGGPSCSAPARDG